MFTALLIALVHTVQTAPSAQLAYLAGVDPDSRTLAIYDPQRRETRVIGNGNRDGAPRWSPDGAWIAYSTQGEEGLEMRIVQPDGADTRTVSKAYTWNDYPRWSPDANLLAYAAGEGVQKRVMVYDIEAGRETEWGGGRSGLLRPAWLPRNDLLLLLTTEENSDWLQQLVPAGVDTKTVPALLAMGVIGLPGAFTTDIIIVTEHGAAPLPASVLPSPEPHEEWAAEPAPDGKALAFESNDAGDREIFVLSRRGASDISNHHAADWNPSWSPDGHWIAFESFRDGTRGIYRISRDSVRVIPVAVDATADCWGAAWAPGGDWLAYVSDRSGSPGVYATQVESGETVTLVDTPAEELSPEWAPEGKP